MYWHCHLLEGCDILRKLFRLQELLDSLFDDGWLSPGLAREGGHANKHETTSPLRQA